MNNKFLLAVTFFLLISIPINNSFSQQLNKSFEVPGGGGSGTNNTSSESNDKTVLYVVGGVIIAGIVIYSILRDKKEKPKEDTTAVILNKNFLKQNLSINEKISNLQSQIPINISFGMQSNGVIKEEKRYFLGLYYNF